MKFFIQVVVLFPFNLATNAFVSEVHHTKNSRTYVRKFKSNYMKSKTQTRLSMNVFDLFNSKKSQIPKLPKVEKPKNFVPPQPRPLAITRQSEVQSVLKSSLALALRLGTSAFVLGWKIDSLFYNHDENDENKKYSLKIGPFQIRDSSTVLANVPRPEKPIILYEYDASPYCKRVRETINILDLTVEYRPCPGARGGTFSADMLERTGRQTLPFMIDTNTGVEMFESLDIINYLLDSYGPSPDVFDRKALWTVTNPLFAITTSTLTSIIRNMPGAIRQSNARPDNEKMKPLELWGYECSPFVRPVREKLGSLCLPHLMISCSRGSMNRDKMIAKTGRFQVPYLVDPNTGVEMYEGPEIVDYLESVYTIKNENNLE